MNIHPQYNWSWLRDFFYNFPANIARCFSGRNLLGQLIAIALTYALVASDFDWRYFEFTRNQVVLLLGLPAAFLGFLLPILVPPSLYLYGQLQKSSLLKRDAAALGQAAITGWLVSSFYKIFTGRLQPPFVIQIPSVDTSRAFNFGLLRHGIFWGWPSSHATVAFAMAVTLIALYPHRKRVVLAALLYAFYIGLGVSATIHWFSDFVAGAIIGSIIGLVIGNAYRAKGGNESLAAELCGTIGV